MTILVPNARAELERFIAERFRSAYGATVAHFCAHLLGMRDANGVWQAAAGYTPAAQGVLYLEHYLDRPVEIELAVPRERIVEVGNLASAARGFGGRFLPALRRYLLDLNYRWVVFTATREVRGILQHLAFEARALAPASPERLPDRGAGWGTYYAHDPSVMAGSIE
jgi:Thermostable hemolysin